MTLKASSGKIVRNSHCVDMDCFSADLIDEKDLEDGEIFEDEDPETETKTVTAPLQEKPKPMPVAIAVATPKKNLETENSNRFQEKLDKPKRDLTFFNKGKRKLLDDEEESQRWKREEKRNRRNNDQDRDGDRQGEEEEDMMLVRGASPQRHEDEEKWDQRGEEGEKDPREGRRTVRSFRRGGTVSRRGERIRGRGRGRGGIRGTKRKRDEAEMCHFFLQGKCHKGSDCPFSHEILPPRKLELCKFFMKDCCAKKDKCLFLHSEFPCKYYHTGLKCYANKKCKFNHGPLTEQLNKLLAKHLDACPKDMMGDYPRRDGRDRNDMRDRMDMRDFRDHGCDPRDRGDLRDRDVDPRDRDADPRDQMCDPRERIGDPRDRGNDRPPNPRDRGDMRDRGLDPRDRGDMRDRGLDPRDRGDFRDNRVGPRERAMRDSREGRKEFNRNRHDKDRDRNDPAMFDLRLNMNDEMKNSDGSHTPMPSPTQNSQDSMKSIDRGISLDKEVRREKDRERDKEHDKERDFEREQEHVRHKHEKAERREERRVRKEKSREHRKERKERREKRRENHRERSSEKTEFSDQETNKNFEPITHSHFEDSPNAAFKVPSHAERDSVEDLDKKNGTTDEDRLPQHLPKKQRELFLRIQQQQREAENSQENAEDEEEENKEAEENWYSSDEEITPPTSLPSVLKSLTSSTTNTTSTSSPAPNNPVMPLLNMIASAASVKLPEIISTPAPVQAPIIPPNLDLSGLTSVFEALKNLQSMSSASATPVVPQTTPVTINKPSSEVTALPDSEPRQPEPVPARVRDPRLRGDVGFIDHHRNSLDGHSSDTDLRQRKLPKPPSSPVGSSDMDLRNLPFKPVQHTAACEIDASIGSHSPIHWNLVPASIIKPDYASLLIQPKPGINDPRLRRVARPVTDDVSLPRDPRQRLVEEPARDPRARPPLLATPIMPPSPLYTGPPATPRYDEDHRPAFYRMDSDMRQFPPPTPRLDDEPYTPGPSRPVDPRQRHSRPDDVDLRPQLTHRVPFMSFNK